ncbi:hypothetical protein C8Q75DRAFT_776661 [Abortiporus biennis]|nr:hypothetical protein C8Q75DRAFT_776661 [Abortiporus biennis]
MTNKDDAVPKAVRNLRSNHTRSMSVTMRRTTPSTIPPSTPRSERARSRAASTVSYSGPHGPARIRVSSLATISTGVVPKAEAVEPIATGGEETIGSFTPTGCPRQQLHSLLGPATRPRFYSVAGRRSNGSPRGAILPHRRQSMTISNSPPDNAPTMNPDSPIPSICRTPSSYSEDSEYFSTAPSSAGPQTPTVTFSPLPPPMLKLPGQMTTPGMSIPASLAALEEKSKFRVRTHCASCRKFGSNFPCCPRCGEMWCSRECRLRSGNGKRHTCKKDASTN